MKKTIYTLMLLITTALAARAQHALSGINYQAVARNSNGSVVAGQALGVRFSIRGGGPNGAIEYQETHQTTTNAMGLFNLQVGRGTPVNGTFAAVPWRNANQFLQVEVNTGGGFQTLGTQQLMSVPFALYAADGNPGPAGAQGPAGPQGPTGAPGPVGPAGNTGPAGATGQKGDTGAQGVPGVKGDKGDTGARGLQGVKGDPGAQGLPGVKGDKGDKGDTGAQGIQGVKGDTGAQGLPGVKGDKGDKGDTGAQGIQGVKGDTGAQGLPGVKGDTGAQGIQGVKGDKGDVGAQGLQGIPGAKGDKGDVGAQGLQGIPGVKGDKGDDGAQGLQGIPGAKGDKGDDGAQGLQGIPGAKGDKGDVGAQGLQGIPGVKGDKGDDGAQGLQGIPGVKGDKGDVGAQGLQGIPGAKGDKGDDGAPGQIGPIGLQGLPGPQGVQGLQGQQGPKGDTGDKGDDGDPGPIGPAGPQGPAGPPGAAGNINGVAAGGDLSGTYPDPAVAKLQGTPVSTTAPAAGQILRFDGTMWAPQTGGGGGFTLPYLATENNGSTLFSLINNGDGVSIEGVNNTTTSSIAAIRGIVGSIAPGGFSTAVRGINNGTGGLGIGVWGSHAGSGWGLYGTTPDGLGVYGTSTANGIGVYANSNSGTGLQATSANGAPANFSIYNNSNNNVVLSANSVGNGNVISVSTTGNGKGVIATTTNGFAVHGITNSQTSAGIIGDNNGAGEAIVGRTTSNIAGAVVGRNDGGGYGVHGFIGTDQSNNAIAVFGRVGINGSTGRAGRFENFNANNTNANAFEVHSNGLGNIPNNALGNASSFKIDNSNSVGAAVRAEVNTIFGNFGAAAVYGVASGTGGYGGIFHSSNPTGNGNALIALGNGEGTTFISTAMKNGSAIEAIASGTGTAVRGRATSVSDGFAGWFTNENEFNINPALIAITDGIGPAGSFRVDNTTSSNAAVKGDINTSSTAFGTAALLGVSRGAGGAGGTFLVTNPNGDGDGITTVVQGSGDGVYAFSAKGNGVAASTDGAGAAVYGWIPAVGTGKAGHFLNMNTANTQPAVTIENRGAGNGLLVNQNNTSGNVAVFQRSGSNVARISNTGMGFFNSGTTNGGADLAEAFDVEGARESYEPGDVMVISKRTDRMMEKSGKAYSTLVAGVYATKPGVLLTEQEDLEAPSDQVPVGVVGVIPTKVCDEGGPIERGDLLVTSSRPGYAMKADPDKVKMGQVLGKALQELKSGSGKIKVLVNVK